MNVHLPSSWSTTHFDHEKTTVTGEETRQRHPISQSEKEKERELESAGRGNEKRGFLLLAPSDVG